MANEDIVIRALSAVWVIPGQWGAEADSLVTLLRQYAPSWLMQMPALLSPAERETLGRSMSGVTQARMLRELAETLDLEEFCKMVFSNGSDLPHLFLRSGRVKRPCS